jgi:iron complex outermembrane receptor protein
LSEVVISKGFSSVLYGPNTMGGAINMVTRRPEGAWQGNFRVGYGLNNETLSYANLGSNQGAWYVQGGVSYLQRDDFRLAREFAATKAEDGGTRDNSYRRDSRATLKLGYTPNADDEYTMGGVYQHGKKGAPPYAGSDPRVTSRYWQWPYWDTAGVFASTKTVLQKKTYLKTRVYYDVFRNSLNSYDDASFTTVTKPYAFRSRYDDFTTGASVEAGTTLLPRQHLKLVLHYKADAHREQNEGSPQVSYRDDIGSVGLEDTITLNERLYSIVGVSEDGLRAAKAENLDAQKNVFQLPLKNSTAFNPQAGLFYTLGDLGTVHASVARKSRLPSIKDRYSYRLGSAIPNPDLAAERSTNCELGYSGRPASRLQVKAAGFYNRVSDYVLPVTIPDPSNPGKTTTQNQNIGRVDMWGAEVAGDLALHRMVQVGSTYTFLHARDLTNDQKLVGIPMHKATGLVRFAPLTRLALITDAEYNSRRWSSSDGVQVTDIYFLWNARVQVEAMTKLFLQLELRNILDRNNALQEGYPEPGRTVFGSVEYRL